MNRTLRLAQAEFDVSVADMVRRARQERTIPCQAGCDACCWDVATTTGAEADEIAERVRSMPSRERAVVLEGIGAWLDGMAAAGLDPDNSRPDLRAYHRARLPCPLLDQERHRCRVYALRPFSCRGHYVVAPDSSPCANRANEPALTVLVMDAPIERALVRMVDGDLARLRREREALLTTALAERLGRGTK